MITSVMIMRKNRYRRWIPWIAFTLGLLVWWGLGWYLAPRLAYTLRFSEKSPALQNNPVPPDVRFRLLDREGNYFCATELMATDEKNERLSLHVINSRTGTCLRTYQFLKRGSLVCSSHGTEHDAVDCAIGSLVLFWHSCGPDIDHLTDTSCHEYFPVHHYDELSERTSELWQWNLLTDERKLVSPLWSKSELKFSLDGKILVEQAPIPPYFMAPQLYSDWISQFCFMSAPTALWNCGAVLLRVRSVPDLRELSPMLIPFSGEFNQIEVSGDGHWLIIVPRAQQAPQGRHESKIQKLIVYNLKTGQVHCTLDLPMGTIGAARAEGRELFSLRIDRVAEGGPPPGNDHAPVPVSDFPFSWKCLHLASGKWIEMKPDQLFQILGTSYLAGNTSYSIQNRAFSRFATLITETEQPAAVVWEIDQAGTLHELSTIPGNFWQMPRLIPKMNQAVCPCLVSLELPDWLETFANKFESLASYLNNHRHAVFVWDYAQHKELCYFPLESENTFEPYVLPDGSTVVVFCFDEKCVKLIGFHAPFASYSPWWARCAGLLTVILVCFAFRRLARS
jgi:hypothetical protein